MILASNVGGVYAADTDIENSTVTGKDISGNDSKEAPGETETEESRQTGQERYALFSTGQR